MFQHVAALSVSYCIPYRTGPRPRPRRHVRSPFRKRARRVQERDEIGPVQCSVDDCAATRCLHIGPEVLPLIVYLFSACFRLSLLGTTGYHNSKVEGNIEVCEHIGDRKCWSFHCGSKRITLWHGHTIIGVLLVCVEMVKAEKSCPGSLLLAVFLVRLAYLQTTSVCSVFFVGEIVHQTTSIVFELVRNSHICTGK